MKTTNPKPLTLAPWQSAALRDGARFVSVPVEPQPPKELKDDDYDWPACPYPPGIVVEVTERDECWKCKGYGKTKEQVGPKAFEENTCTECNGEGSAETTETHHYTVLSVSLLYVPEITEEQAREEGVKTLIQTRNPLQCKWLMHWQADHGPTAQWAWRLELEETK